MNQDSVSLYDRIGGRDGISVLLRHFYADVRQHGLIGPVFNERIKDWPAHLASYLGKIRREHRQSSAIKYGKPERRVSGVEGCP